MGNHRKKIKKLYERVVKRFDKDEVHDFRVEVKKMRALLRMLFHNQKGKKYKVPKQVKGLYKCTGQIRNLQLQEEKIIQFTFKDNAWPAEYIAFLRSKQQSWILKAGKYRGKKPINRTEESNIKKGMKRLDRKKVSSYVLNQHGLLQNLILLEHFEDSDLHQLRKHLKDILYNWKFIKLFFIPLLPHFLDKKRKINAFTIMLGEFQDTCMEIKLLNGAFYPFSENNEKSVLFNIQKELELHKIFLEKRIINIMAPSIVPV